MRAHFVENLILNIKIEDIFYKVLKSSEQLQALKRDKFFDHFQNDNYVRRVKLIEGSNFIIFCTFFFNSIS